MNGIVMSIVLSMALALVFLNGWMYLQQPAMIFYPMRTLEAEPTDWGMPFEDVRLTTADAVELHGWYIPAPNATRVLLFMHGNAGNISHRRDSIAIFRRLGLDVFIFDYRGYGRSQGAPDEAGLYRDAQAAWRYLTETRGIAAQDIVIFGRSLGGAVAAQLAAQQDAQQAAQMPARALILESTLSSARDFARQVFPLLARLVVVRYHFDTSRYLQSVTCPVLVLHSPDDEVMPYALGERVFRAAREPKRFVRLRGDHNGGFLLSQPEYEQALGDFLAGLPAVDRPASAD
ncbi:MAG TPA: alpha/beta hydrolase [Gammaproteobacteria bacterium]